LAQALAPALVALLPQQHDSQDGWLDSKQAADYLGVSLSTVHRLTAARSIDFEQASPGGRVYFRRAALDAWRAK
jgi:excisionase family DNA binding protein